MSIKADVESFKQSKLMDQWKIVAGKNKICSNFAGMFLGKFNEVWSNSGLLETSGSKVIKIFSFDIRVFLTNNF